MTVFSYRARQMDGTLAIGELVAENEAQAVREMKSRGLFVSRLQKKRDRRWHLPQLMERPFSKSQAGPFFRQLAVLLQAGMSLYESLGALAGEEGGRRQAFLRGLQQRIAEGQSFSNALQRHTDVFSPVAVGMVAVGEQAGRLPEMVAELAGWMEEEQRAREKLKTVLAYPMILFVETVAIAVFLTGFVLPAFSDLFLSMQAELPWPTQLLLTLGIFAREYAEAIALSVVFALAGCSLLFRRPQVRACIDRWRLFGPLFGRLRREVVWMKTYRALSVLTACGIPLDEAVTAASAVAGNRAIARVLANAVHGIQNGFPLSDLLAGEASLPHVLLDFLRTGELAGCLPSMLGRGADYAAQAAENQAARLQAMAEPAAYLVIFALVGGCVAAVALPWMDMMTMFV